MDHCAATIISIEEKIRDEMKEKECEEKVTTASISSLTKSELEKTVISEETIETGSEDQASVPPALHLSKARKNLIVFILAVSVFLAPMSSICLLPAIGTIAEYFHCTRQTINLTISVYEIMMAVSPCLLNPLCNIFGRRIMFLSFLTGFLIASIITCVSSNLIMFFIFRGLTALFGTTFFGVSALIIGDLFVPTERGTAQGWTLLGCMIGTPIGPVIGGLIVTYSSNWKWIIWIQVFLIFFEIVLVWFFIPETMSARTKEELKVSKYNPFSTLICFKYKNMILAGVLASSISYACSSMLLPISVVMNPRFNLTTPLLSSLFYLPVGFGYICGASFGGRYADYTVKRYIKKRGYRLAEDRLYSIIIGYVFILPITNLVYGWCIEKRKGGVVVPVLMLFLNGVGQTLCFSSSNTYCIDCMPAELKSDSIGGNYFIRFVFSAVGAATVLLQIEHIGVGWTSTINACFFAVGSVCLFLLIAYGKNFRPRGETEEEEEE
ncbi:hypothetical protein WICPIJ_008166 [Wickerhamomyces pijperi]|uniref:Major facilitator superfamily (MFS) profile domain-containing protein n=1 Tax=Wickerhamomyces pijperi TaxID=599730 RepID=A0A9P8Q0Q1_WICPI|nr:hypothetical protein WICPIJ_008166 [Wickerhamomyces pijperi]